MLKVNNNLKQAVILAGGEGSRLKKISADLPKPMTVLNNKPLLQHIIEQCVLYNIKDIKLLVSYKRDVIENYFGDGSKYGARIEYIVEDVPKGTAGALIDALPKLDEIFLVLYGDTFFDIDFFAFIKFHSHKNGDSSIFLHPNDHPYDSDLVEIDRNYKVQKIHPYPHDNQWRKNLVNAAVYIIKNEAIKNITFDSKKPDIAKDLFPRMLNLKKRVYGYLSSEYIKDMGTPERLLKVESDIQSGKVKALSNKISKAAIFLDRDGTINKQVGHLYDQNAFELIKNSGKAISMINEAGILSIVITNQPVIARGELSEDGLAEIHNKMDTLLGRVGAYIDRLYYCPHHPDSGFVGEIKELKFDCNCRKPKIGLIDQAKNDLNIDLNKSWLIGDSYRDIAAAKKAGLRSVLVLTGESNNSENLNIEPDFVAENLYFAVRLIIEELANDY